MDVQGVFTEVKDHGFSDLTDPQLLRMLNATYYEICTREPWYFLENTVSPTLVIGDINMKLNVVATDVSKILSAVIPSLNITMTPEREENLLRAFQDITAARGTQQPIYYYASPTSSNIEGSLMWNVFPAPDTAYVLKVKYVRTPNTLTSSGAGSAETDILLPIRHHELLVLGTKIRCYRMQDDFEAAIDAETAFEKRYLMMKGDLWFRQYDTAQSYIEDIYQDHDIYG